MSEHPLQDHAYRCKDDPERNCRMSCSKFMRAECDGRSLMIAADGSWYWNEILRRKRRKKRSEGVKVNITVDPGDVPDGVKFVR